MVKTSSVVHALASAGVALLLVGCNNSNKQASTAAPDKTGQVIAKVGPDDVTIHELTNEYRHLGVTADRVNDDATRAALTSITRRKALAQRAQAAGLDREPTVLLDILRSKEDVLAGALLQRDIQAKVSGIGKSEIDRYINSHGDAFGGRERFDVEQVTIGLTPLTGQLVDAVKDMSSLDAIANKAAELKQPFTRGLGALYSGDLPPDLVSKLRTRKAEDIFLVRNQGTAAFIKVRGQSPDPLTGDAAQQRAQVMMRNEAAREEVNKKGDATVTFLGTYAKLMETAAPAGEGAAPSPAPAGDTAPKP